MKSYAIKISILLVSGFVAGTLPVLADTFTVTNSLDSGAGSLRQAIDDANSNPGLDTIVFDIPGAGYHVINVEYAYEIYDPLIIDGYTQEGAHPNTLDIGNDAVLNIVLNGSSGFGPGMNIYGGGTTVRGLVMGWFTYAIYISSGSTNVIDGNFIGVDMTGTNSFPNQSAGIYVDQSSGNVIGGTTPQSRNIVSGNEGNGVEISSFGFGGGGNTVQGNYIGTDALGGFAIPNGGSGIGLSSDSNAIIGNVISGNGYHAVDLSGLGSAINNTVFQGNFIGTDATGTSPIPNSGNGLNIFGAQSMIGGTDPGAGNIIAFNDGSGVVIGSGEFDTQSIGNTILGNSIFLNYGLGIDLGNVYTPDGVTPNDDCDLDDGPNGLQNFPILSSAAVIAGEIVVSGSLNSVADTDYTLEFFANRFFNYNGHGDGEIFLGRTNVTTDAECNVDFSVTFTNSIHIGYWISATATDPDGNTSEFSPCRRLGGAFAMECFPYIGVGLPMGRTNAVINYPTPGFVGDCNGLVVEYDPPSGSTFPLGLSPVTCTASNGVGEVAVCHFIVSLETNVLSTVTNTYEYALSGAANAVLAYPEINTILFDIPGSGPHTINDSVKFVSANKSFAGPLSLYIDGYSQPGASPNTLENGSDAVLQIALRQPPFGPSLPGIEIWNTNTTGMVVIRGLVVSGFGYEGIKIQGDHCVVEGCFIGTDASGTLNDGNGFQGITIDGAFNRIGGILPAARNLISGNSLANVSIARSIIYDPYDLVGNVVIGNLIGPQRDGATALPGFSSAAGVQINSGTFGNAAHDNRIGGMCAGEGNVIAFNNSYGVRVSGATNGINNAILGNSIYSNGTEGVLGIDLDPFGVTENDAGDVDMGPNNLQNFPVLSSADGSGGSSTFVGTLNSQPNMFYRIEFFASEMCDSTGYGEGQTFLGFTEVTTDGSGNANFNVMLPITIPSDQPNITATATDLFGNTSEFSQCVGATVAPGEVGPYLSIILLSDNQTSITWTPDDPGWTLQEKALLTTPDWTDAASGSTNPVVIPTSLPTTFYRLFKP